MRCRVKLFSTSSQILASDGSYIPAQVLQDYLNSDDYKNSIESKRETGFALTESEADSSQFDSRV